MDDTKRSNRFAILVPGLKNAQERLPVLFSWVVGICLFAGWRLSRYELIVPGRGVGFALGVTGTFFMTFLLIYPLRKRIWGSQSAGRIKRWFQIHMILGILGPVCILFHSNFHMGSMNSDVALISMLVVAVSGIFGRYIYSKIHYGLYGQRAELIELRGQFELQKKEMGRRLTLFPGIKENLSDFSDQVLVPSHDFMDSIRRLLLTEWNTFIFLRGCRRITDTYLDRHAASHHWSAGRKHRIKLWIRKQTLRFVAQSRRVAEFNFYERAFSLWHVMHIPLVFILAGAVVIHIIAVSFY